LDDPEVLESVLLSSDSRPQDMFSSYVLMGTPSQDFHGWIMKAIVNDYGRLIEDVFSCVRDTPRIWRVMTEDEENSYESDSFFGDLEYGRG
jgi:hypothetical protein